MACYDLVEAIHKLYRPVDGESDDYVSNPKPSGYQSLHTAVVGPDGALLEFQVRTRAMHEAAEFGTPRTGCTRTSSPTPTPRGARIPTRA